MVIDHEEDRQTVSNTKESFKQQLPQTTQEKIYFLSFLEVKNLIISLKCKHDPQTKGETEVFRKSQSAIEVPLPKLICHRAKVFTKLLENNKNERK